MKVKSSQKGFTLVEMLVVMAVGGMLLSGIVTAIFQTVNITAGSSTQITALENIRNSAYWVSKDVRMAATTNLVDGALPVNYLVLEWTSWYDDKGTPDPSDDELNDIYHRCKYTLSGGKLQRTYGTYDPTVEKLDKNSDWRTHPEWATDPTLIPDIKFWPTQADEQNATKTVGRYIFDIQFSQLIPNTLYPERKIILVTITASPEGKPETAEQKTYHMYLQPKEEPVQ